MVHYHRAETQAEAEETASLVRAEGVKAVLVQGDLSIVANIRKMYDVAMNEFGRVDIVVNNAGYIKKKPFVEITEEEFDRCVGINTKGLYFSMQEAAKRIADNGRIINIGTSLLGATTGMYSAYAGTKAPVEAFTRALAKEIGKRGITVNVVAPGAVDTPFFHSQETPRDGGVHQEGARVWSTRNRRRHCWNDRVPRIAGITMALCPDNLRQQCLLSAIAIASDVATIDWLVV